VSSAASEEQLGRLLSVHQRSRRDGIALGCALLVLFPFAFLAGTKPLVAPVVAAVFWPFAVWGLRTSPLIVRSLWRQRIRLFEQGFVVTGVTDAPQIWRWDQIAVVFERSRRRGTAWFNYGVSALYTVVGTDGRAIRLATEWTGIRALGREICLRTAAAQLPDVLAAVDEGHGVRFGDIVVDASGVTCRRGSAPWSEIDFALTRERRVRLEIADGFRPLVNTPAWRVPNVALFIQLVRVCLQREAAVR